GGPGTESGAPHHDRGAHAGRGGYRVSPGARRAEGRSRGGGADDGGLECPAARRGRPGGRRGVVGRGRGARAGGRRGGAVVLRAGRVRRPQESGVPASLGLAQLLVRQKPRVAILSTGDEVAEP